VSASPRDVPERWAVTQRRVLLPQTHVIGVRDDTVDPGDGQVPFRRQVVEHPGAVGIVCLDDAEQVLVVHQYRHPVGHRLLEVPAGLLDVPDEPYHVAAARELAEEGHVRAERWEVLVDYFTSPGMSTESLRVFLARGIQDIPVAERHVGHHEEADMPVAWVPLDELVAGVLAGDLHNPTLCVGVLATWVARAQGRLDDLRPADAPWPSRAAVPS
jgi:ADP-ribose pyrophosphatase